MTRARAALRDVPPAVPLQLAAAGLVVWLLAEDGGSPVSRWGPVAILSAWVLGTAVVALPRPRPSRAVLVGVAALAAWVAWSYLSISWSRAPGDAWFGANRLVPCAALLALAALWPVPGRWPLAVLGALLAGIAGIAAAVAVELLEGPGEAAFVSARLAAPAGYPNATAMLWQLGLWPMVVLAAMRPVRWPLRAAAAAAAVVLAQLVLLTESRGAFLALPLTALVLLAVLPGRVRLAGVLAVVVVPAAAAAPAGLDVSAAIAAGDAVGAPAAQEAAQRAMEHALLAALVAGALVAAWARGERHVRGATAARAHRAAAIALVGAGIAGAAAGVAAAGGPGEVPDRAQAAWASFRGGYADNRQDGSRLTGGLGSDRYDFYRVALGQLRDAPLRGAGVEQFRAAYLREGRGLETPRHPHSFPLRVLSQTGLVGGVLVAAFVGALLLAAVRAARAGRAAAGAAARAAGGTGGAAMAAGRAAGAAGGAPGAAGGAAGAAPAGATVVRATVAAAGLGGFLAWAIHGSADWFLPFAGLSAAAWLLLGLAAGAGTARAAAKAPAPARPPLARSGAAAAATALLVVVLTGVLAGPWLADRDMARAGALLATRPAEALARLDRAARFDPLSAGPLVAEGTARLRLGDRAGADAAFAAALERHPDDQYATLMRGALASARGDEAAAEALLARAVALAPRYELARDLLAGVRAGDPVDLGALQRELLRRARR